MSASKMFCSTQQLDISCLQAIGQVKRTNVNVSVSLVDGVGIGLTRNRPDLIETASVRHKLPEKVYRKSQNSKGLRLSSAGNENGSLVKNPSLRVAKPAEPNGSSEGKDKNKVIRKWAAYGGCIPSILYALETINDIEEALKPWEDSLNNKERSIILKEQTNWERALEIFEWFKGKGCYELNVIHYNIILRILGKAQRWKEVEHIWAEMEQKKIIPTNSTYGTLIDVYSKGGLKEQALLWLDKMNKQGLHPDEVTMGIVVQMYKKSGEFTKAQQFFKEWSLCNQGVSSANGTSQPQKSFSSYTYNTLIDTYGKAGQLREASDTFAQMLREGIVPNTVTFNTMMHICGNCGHLEEVENLMVKMEELRCPPDTRTYNILISLYAKNDNIEMAANYFKKMKACGLQPDPVGYRTLLYAFSIRHMVQEAEALVSEMDELGLEIDESTQTALIRMYINAGLLEQSWSWFERFHLAGKMSSECYSANIDAFGERGHVLLAEKTFNCCLSENKLSALEFNVMIKAYGICKKYDSACKLFDLMEKCGICPDKCTYSSLIQILSGAELPYQARCYVRKMQEAELVQNCIPYCAVISSFVKLGELGVAEELYEEMVSYDIKPDIVVFGILINAFAEVGSVKEATKYVNAMKAAGFTGNSVIFNSLIKLYTKVGYIEEAQDIYQLLQLSEEGPDIYSSNCMIHLYSEYSMVRGAEEIFKDLKQRGEANEFSYSKMLYMYKKIGRYSEAIGIAHEMNKGGMLTDMLSYNNVIGLFVTDGRLKEAAEVFYQMIDLGIQPDGSTFRSLGIALIRLGVSKKAVDKLETARRKDYKGGLQAWVATLRSML
ncbi:pentatricopeptide repeat-containing protein At3g23020 [Aristolochia californica]|uniref:pentatricopeptide repeat-containing protein At3g23020 n=1 Tax=Aristolochia californica TaxID=171875 RepID=UPI0035E28E63